MAKGCNKCGNPIFWATLANGKDAGKKRPFDPDGSENGRYGIKATEEVDSYDNQILEATYYDDPIKGLSEHEKLFNNHFFTCEADKKGGAVYRRPATMVNGAIDGNKCYVTVAFKDGKTFSGELPQEGSRDSQIDDSPF
jgi:hypothetical protein